MEKLLAELTPVDYALVAAALEELAAKIRGSQGETGYVRHLRSLAAKFEAASLE